MKALQGEPPRRTLSWRLAAPASPAPRARLGKSDRPRWEIGSTSLGDLIPSLGDLIPFREADRWVPRV